VWISTSFQTGVAFDNVTFWRTFGNALQKDNQHVEIPSISSASDFISLLSIENKERIFEGKDVVLFVDEFDVLYKAPNEIQDSILSALRAMKQRCESYCLQSFVGIGPFSILNLIGKFFSPFNVREAVQVKFWTLKEVKQLFDQFTEARRMKLDDSIVEDIFERTGGYVNCVSSFTHTDVMRKIN
jgi:hypothetical protein